MADDRISRMGDKRQIGATEANRKGQFKPGQSGNPGGAPSIKRDLERAKLIGVPPEVTATLDDWFADASDKLAELGADGFVTGLRAALEDACRRVLPLDLAEARAMWWRTILPVALAGPQGPKDSNWTYASQEVGVRLLGKPKETIEITDGAAPAIDWSRVPAEERDGLLAAITKLQGYVATPSGTEH